MIFVYFKGLVLKISKKASINIVIFDDLFFKNLTLDLIIKSPAWSSEDVYLINFCEKFTSNLNYVINSFNNNLEIFTHKKM